MRDIAEVRGGFDTYDFRRNATPPSDPDCCLSLIGSERTISLELPGKVRHMSLQIQKIKKIKRPTIFSNVN